MTTRWMGSTPFLYRASGKTTVMDTHQYTNVNYPHAIDPPFVPHNNPAGAYLRDFTYTPLQDAPRVNLNFEALIPVFTCGSTVSTWDTATP
ncbi:hypothetical protein [Rothia sp. ZJ932]|uniref:hypothetical protein n=1 Tax=Rothia sp. ZJ932 TaxID=2810516 RepID=UPI00196742AC|nr:hypothetical protein [Rothia sp. ZJ932]QRZ61537.1 hypothetical protein JR346_10055 [Rothia sp. ZJ932]